MAAYAEGLNLLQRGRHRRRPAGDRRRDDAAARPPVLPVRPRSPTIAEVWRRGSVVASWLLDLTAQARSATPKLERLLRPRVGLRRGALDRRWPRSTSARRAACSRRPLQPLRLARRGRVRQPAAVGHALGLRRAPGEEHHVVSPRPRRGEIASRHEIAHARPGHHDRAARRRRARPGARRTPSQAPQAARGGRPAAEHQRLPRQPRRLRARSRCRAACAPPPAGPSTWPRTSTRCARRTATRSSSAPATTSARARWSRGLFHDEPTIEAFNAMGVDISSVGNHEFDEGSAELLRMQDGGCHPVDGCQDGDGFAGADFDYLAANVDRRRHRQARSSARTRSASWRREGRLHRRRARGHADDRHPAGVEGLTFGDEADAINKYTAKLKKKGVRAIVVLMHQGDTVDLGQVNDCSNPERARWPTSSAARARRSTSISPATPTRPTTASIGGKRAPARRRSGAC